MAPNWMKDILHTRSSLYVDNRTVVASPSTIRSSTVDSFDMAFASPTPLDRCVSAFDPPSPTSKSPDSSLSRAFSKYGIWPRMKRQFTLPKTPSQESVAIYQHRSPTSLSDNAVHYPALHSGYQGASLSQRRKVSVPELRRKPTPENFKNEPSVVEAALVESPTLGGFPEFKVSPKPVRPKLRTVASDLGTHTRSSSCPDGSVGRVAATDDDIFASQPRSSSLRQPNWLAPIPGSEWMTFNPTRPLSPIFSPLEATTPVSVIVPSDYVEPPPAPITPRPAPRVDPIINVTPMSIPSRKPVRSPVTSPISHPQQNSSRMSPNRNSDREKFSPTRKPGSPKLSICIPKAIPEEYLPVLPVQRNQSPVHADRGRTIVRAKSIKSMKEELIEYATLPTGLLPADATIVMPQFEKESLRKQASSQAERFEILGSKHVNSLSKELRNLDERCDYLRKTYKSLRAGRQKLHSRVLNYLKSDANFSKDRLLKQEESLVELDRAIDDWAFKLERAENRRLRVRQKLLEHVAASMMLNIGGAVQEPQLIPGYSTPPHSGGGRSIITPEPLRVDRKDIESIKIYADTQVLSLFSDIESAIGRMCETSC